MSTTTNVTDFESLIRSYLVSKVSSKYPDLDVSENSVFDNLHIKPIVTEIQPLIDATNTVDITTDLSYPDNISDDDLNNIGYYNYGLVRQSGIKASTTLSVSYTRVSDTENVVIPSGTTFQTPDGLVYETISTYTFTPSEMQASYNPNTVLYTVDIQITATAAGTSYNVAANTITVFASSLSPYLSNVANGEAVTNGTDEETKADYVSRLRRWYVTRYLGTNPGYGIDIMNTIPDITDSKIIGKNDAEMTRDLMTIVVNGQQKQMHMGGKVDMYIKGSILEQRYASLTITSNRLQLSEAATSINTGSIHILNLTSPAKTVVFTSAVVGDKLVLTIDNTGEQSYDESDGGILQVAYNTTGGDAKSEQFTCKAIATSLEIPFYEIVSIYQTSDATVTYTSDILSLARTDIYGNTIDSSSIYYRSNQELVTMSIASNINIINGTDITVAYSINASVASLNNHYNVDEDRIITTDILIKEASQKYVNMWMEVKLREMETLTDTRKAQIENAVASYISGLGIGDAAKESDIVAAVYASETVMEYLLYIKLPFIAFYVPANVSDVITATRTEASFIAPDSTSYMVLNKIKVVELA